MRSVNGIMPSIRHPLKKALDAPAEEFVRAGLERSFQAREIQFTSDQIVADLPEGTDEAIFAERLARLLYISRSVRKDVLHSHESGRSYAQDPLPALKESGMVQPIAEGMFLFQGPFLETMHFADHWLMRLARDLNAVEQEYPTLWPVDLYKQINYFKDFPQQVILCTTVKQDFASLERFSRQHDRSLDFDSVALDDTLTASRFGLESAVCDCCYYALRGSRDYPDTVYTCMNKVFRNETSPTGSLDRLINFTVRDIMFVGSEEFVLEKRQQMIDACIGLVRDLGLDCRIETADDPFFTNESANKNLVQYALSLKYEILARLPHSGKDMAVGSINLHQDFFGNVFDIILPDGSAAFSGCLGIGFERLAYALFCQYGPDAASWPKALRDFLEF